MRPVVRHECHDHQSSALPRSRTSRTALPVMAVTAISGLLQFCCETAVPHGSEKSLAPDESRAVAARVAEELARRHMSRQQLTALAKISLSTLEKGMSGRRPFTLATVVRLEEALGLPLRREQEAPGAAGLAPAALGSYSRPAVAWLEGDYLTLRPSFFEPDTIFAYLTRVSWSEANSGLVFSESERLDAEYTQGGVVSVPHQSGHIYLVTNEVGQYRLIIVSRPTIRGELHGILTTLRAERGAHLTPVAAPIVFVPLKSFPAPQFGHVKPGQAGHEPFRRLLRQTIREPFAMFLTGE